jgi:deoxycytidylate deaminase
MKNCCFVIAGPLILVATGYSSTDKCQVIDVSSSTSCGNLPSYPFSMSQAAGGVINNTPIICGGYRPSASPSQLDSCYRFNANSNSWNLHSTMTARRSQHAATVMKDALFISGGYDGNGNGLASTEFIHADGSVTSGPSLPVARRGHCMVTLHDSKVIIIGANHHSSLRKNVLVYDPAKSKELRQFNTYSCNNITTTLIQISHLFYFGFFSKTNHQMII